MSHLRFGAVALAVAIGWAATGRQPVAAQASGDPQRNTELGTTVDDGFTFAVVGDIILAHSLEHRMSDPGFASVVALLRDADVATGNLEGNIIDGRSLRSTAGGGRHGAEPGAAESLRNMGFDIVARANNHANDFGMEGLLETSRYLDAVGVVHAGFGDTYAAARAARFYTSPKGRVGMVSTSPSGPHAAPANGEWPGRGGLSGLGLTRFFMMPEKSWEAVRTIRDHFPNATGFYARGANSDDHIAMVGHQFRKAPAGVTDPYYSFEMNDRDLRDVAAAVREGKMRSDFVTVAVHAHQFHDAKGGYRGDNIPEADHLDTNPSVADYLQVLAKAVIDDGADVFQGTGVHVLRGIEIYRNRPIFYGLGEFIRQRDVGGISGRGDLTRDECLGCPFPAKYESIVAVSRFDGGQLTEVRLHPIELRYDSERMAHRGIPRTAPPETARRILTRLQELSAPFGTTITIESGVGYIRPSATSSASAKR